MQHTYHAVPLRWVPRPLAALALLLATAGAARAQTPAVSFGPLATYGTGSTTGPRDLAVADVNGDGRPDLLAANGGNMTSSAGNTAGVLLGTSTGIFRPLPTPRASAAAPTATRSTLRWPT